MIVDSLLHNNIDLDGSQPRFFSGSDPRENFVEVASTATHVAKNLFIKAVQANRYTV